jgi:inorganic pyrophosphatase
MSYPGNYDFVPHAIAADNAPIGMLIVEDNSGQDEKIIAVPSPHLTRRYEGITNYSDIPIGERARRHQMRFGLPAQDP